MSDLSIIPHPELVQLLQENSSDTIFLFDYYLPVVKSRISLRNALGEQYDNYRENLQQEFRNAIRNNTSITDIIIDGGQGQMSHLHEFSVRQMLSFVKPNDLALFLQQFLQLRNLRYVEMICDRCFPVVKMIFKESTNLQELKLYFGSTIDMNEMDQLDLRSLPSDAVCSSLQKIILGNSAEEYYNGYHNKEKTVLLLDLIPKMLQLQSVELHNWQIISPNVLVDIVSNLPMLKSLKLSHINFVDDFDSIRPFNRQTSSNDWRTVLVDALKLNSSLTEITLHSINVSESVLFSMISEVIRYHPAMKSVTVTFYKNRYSSELLSPRIRDSSAQLVQQNRNIANFIIDTGRKKDDFGRLVDCYTKLNRIYDNTKELREDEDNDDKDWRVEALIEADEDLGCIYALLLENPTVVQMGLRCRNDADSRIYRNSDFQSIHSCRKRRLIPYKKNLNDD